MVIANGFISQTKLEVMGELLRKIKGKKIQQIPLPYVVETMTYYISDIGEVFSSQKYKDFYLTKPLKIEKRYNSGCNIRVALGKRKYKNELLQNLMYWTWIAKDYIEDIEIVFKDNNQYNYKLDNLLLKMNLFQTLHDNLYLLQDVYKLYFIAVVRDVCYFFDDVSLDDAKDIASDSFIELCNKNYAYKSDYFVGLWILKARQRGLDLIKYRSRFDDVIFNDKGEENIKSENKFIVEDIDYRKYIKGNQCKKIIELYLQNEKPIDIAKYIGCTPGTVSSHITRSIQKLRKIFEKDIFILQ